MSKVRLAIVIIVSMITLIVLIVIVASLIAPSSMIVYEWEPKEMESVDGKFEVDVPKDALKSPIVRFGFHVKMYGYTLKDPVAEQIAERVKAAGPWSTQVAMAEYARDIVRENVEYVWDEEPYDIWQLPWETVKRGAGDCEDFVILTGSVLHYLGIGYIILFTPNHCTLAVAVDCDGKYYEEHDGVRYYHMDPQAYMPIGYEDPGEVYDSIGEHTWWRHALALAIFGSLTIILTVALYNILRGKDRRRMRYDKEICGGMRPVRYVLRGT